MRKGILSISILLFMAGVAVIIFGDFKPERPVHLNTPQKNTASPSKSLSSSHLSKTNDLQNSSSLILQPREATSIDNLHLSPDSPNFLISVDNSPDLTVDEKAADIQFLRNQMKITDDNLPQINLHIQQMRQRQLSLLSLKKEASNPGTSPELAEVLQLTHANLDSDLQQTGELVGEENLPELGRYIEDTDEEENEVSEALQQAKSRGAVLQDLDNPIQSLTNGIGQGPFNQR